RAVGPMQFLPGTWGAYAADGNGDGVADPHNVFDAALAAGKYLCAGGLDLRDPAQELRAVLRYNNSMAYAANVLSWARAYRSGGSPTQVRVSPDLVAPGSLPPVGPGTDMSAVTTMVQAPEVAPQTSAPPQRQYAPTQVMITLPGLPPIPCGIFCPPPPPVNPCVAQPVPAPMPQPGQPGTGRIPLAPGQRYGAAPGQLPDPDVNSAEAEGIPQTAGAEAVDCTQPGADTATGPAPDAPRRDGAPRNPEPAITTPPAPEPEPEPVPDAESTPTPQPGITLPFGIVIPLPGPPPPPPAG
ncbi:lytic transglycosylase domain-containing protein, partial [Nocardia sp. SC052]|uniref:lytic transglycosylase domain-containing protein n=1 Tax=Nocardia sichangensis TaxID=3385975 RepID=UPI0039A3C13F